MQKMNLDYFRTTAFLVIKLPNVMVIWPVAQSAQELVPLSSLHTRIFLIINTVILYKGITNKSIVFSYFCTISHITHGKFVDCLKEW